MECNMLTAAARQLVQATDLLLNVVIQSSIWQYPKGQTLRCRVCCLVGCLGFICMTYWARKAAFPARYQSGRASGECQHDEQHQDGYKEGDEAQLPSQPHLLEHVVHLFLCCC